MANIEGLHLNDNRIEINENKIKILEVQSDSLKDELEVLFKSRYDLVNVAREKEEKKNDLDDKKRALTKECIKTFFKCLFCPSAIMFGIANIHFYYGININLIALYAILTGTVFVLLPSHFKKIKKMEKEISSNNADAELTYYEEQIEIINQRINTIKKNLKDNNILIGDLEKELEQLQLDAGKIESSDVLYDSSDMKKEMYTVSNTINRADKPMVLSRKRDSK